MQVRFGNFMETVTHSYTTTVQGDKIKDGLFGPKYAQVEKEVPVTVGDLVQWTNNDSRTDGGIHDSGADETQRRLGYLARIQAAGFSQLHQDQAAGFSQLHQDMTQLIQAVRQRNF